MSMLPRTLEPPLSNQHYHNPVFCLLSHQALIMESRPSKRRATFHLSTTPHSLNLRTSHTDRARSTATPNPPLSSQGTFTSRTDHPDRGRESGSSRRHHVHLTDDDLDQVIVAIDVRDAGTVGCSYYSAHEEKLYLLGDLPSAGAEVIDTCLYLPELRTQ